MSNWQIILQASIIVAIGLLISFLGVESTTGQTVYSSQDSSPFIDVKSASCTWQRDHYEVCAYVAWQRREGTIADKAKVFVSGSDVPLANAPAYRESPFTYCVDAGTYDGRRSISAYLLGKNEGYLDVDSDTLVFCKKDNRQIQTETKSASFRAKSINNRAQSSGIYEVRNFGGKPISCVFDGSYKTDNRPKLGAPTLYCHGATGTFSGYADTGEQYVINDADEFNWKGRGIASYTVVNPPRERVDGYAIYMRTCDAIKYNEGRYYVRAHVSEFTDDGLILEWEYNNDDSKPAVDFIFTITCDIAVPQEPSVFPAIPEEAEEPAVEQPKSTVPAFPEPAEISEEPPKPQELEPRLGLWQRIKRFISILFS